MPPFTGALVTIMVFSLIIQAFRVWANEGHRRVLVCDFKLTPEMEADTVRMRSEIDAARRETRRLRLD